MSEKTTKADQLRTMREAKFSRMADRPGKRHRAPKAPSPPEHQAKIEAAREAIAIVDAREHERKTTNEDDMAAKRKKAKSATKKAKPAKARKKTAAAKPTRKTKAKTNGSGSKLEGIRGLLTRKEGCTRVDVLGFTGWPAVSIPQQAKSLGLKLRITKDDDVPGKPKRYFGS